MTDYWQPWTPAVGDRVRVRLSPECQHPRGKRGGKEFGHFSQEDGRIGTVCVWPDDWTPPVNGHTVCIDFDVAFEPFAGIHIDGAVFAPSELEPLAPREGG